MYLLYVIFNTATTYMYFNCTLLLILGALQVVDRLIEMNKREECRVDIRKVKKFCERQDPMNAALYRILCKCMNKPKDKINCLKKMFC